jgi:sugar phosphate isomerase/epimerase
MQYGISTHLYHASRLTRQHLEEVAAAGFDAVEVFATRSHVDYHDASALEMLAEWLRGLELRLHGIHGPIMDAFGRGDKWQGKNYSLASPDPAKRQEAVRETVQALEIGRRVHADVMVLHLGTPRGHEPVGGSNARDAALRSLEEVRKAAEPLGVTLAIEVIPNEISTAEMLVRMLEEDLVGSEIGICLDFGHAFLLGDLVDAVEHVSGHLITTHVHDNDGKTDGHLVPFDGRIDWAPALMNVQKIGYDGTLLFELAETAPPRDVLAKARRVRTRFDQMMI